MLPSSIGVVVELDATELFTFPDLDPRLAAVGARLRTKGRRDADAAAARPDPLAVVAAALLVATAAVVLLALAAFTGAARRDAFLALPTLFAFEATTVFLGAAPLRATFFAARTTAPAKAAILPRVVFVFRAAMQ
jgi:hypothetical protein